MGPHHGAIEKNIFHVGVVGKVLMHIFPDVMVAPAGKTLIDRVPVAIFFGQKAPLGPTAGGPEHAFHEKTAIFFLPGVHARMFLQEKIDISPLVVLEGCV